MKRFWLVLLSLGLIMAFSASAFAVDVKVSGSYYAAGMYQSKTTFVDNGYYATPSSGFNEWFYSNGGPSTAFYFQRLRVQTDFIVSPSLKLVTRFDALERIWGGARSESASATDTQSAATRMENENIGFDWAYVEYVSPIGMFDVGYMDDGGWGTVFGDSSVPQGMISWAVQKNGWTGFSKLLRLVKTAIHRYILRRQRTTTPTSIKAAYFTNGREIKPVFWASIIVKQAPDLKFRLHLIPRVMTSA